MIFFYNLFTISFYPIFILIIYLRKFINKEHQDRYKEKIFSNNFNPTRNLQKKLLWFHAASIGEVKSILPVIFKLKEKNKNLEFLITTVTLSAGNLITEKIEGYENIYHRFFPIDVNFLIKKFLDDWDPDLILFVDSEIWPNLIIEIKKRNISSCIINGRITYKTFKKWMAFPKIAKNIFSTFDLCLTSSLETKRYLKTLKAKNIKYIGNLKLSGFQNLKKINTNNDSFLRKKKIWCATSTHSGEEVFCLKTHLNLKKKLKNLITIIIPRHIHRSSKIKKLCDKLNLTSQVLNTKDLIKKNKEIIIINSFGTASIYYKFSKSVFVGKSILKNLEKVGGQNPIEAATLGCKIYHGPYVSNFKEIYKLLNSFGIAQKISNENDLLKNLINDLKSSKKRTNVNKKIINLGKKILNNTVIEINKFLK